MKNRAVKINVGLHVLNTSLFYPALLGSIFFYLLEDFNSIIIDLNKLIYIIAALGIIISFSVDYLYTYSTKSIYTWKLFILDLLIIILLFLSYKTLLFGIKQSAPIKIFYIYFLSIHLIFIVWDLFCIPKSHKSKKILFFDFSGLCLTAIFYFFFFQKPLYGVIFLWIFTSLYVILGLQEINKLIIKEEKQIA